MPGRPYSRGVTSTPLHCYYADIFAGELLMPSDELEAMGADGRDPIAVAARFGVSITRAVWWINTLKRLGVLTD